jgi:hypothetical protein
MYRSSHLYCNNHVPRSCQGSFSHLVSSHKPLINRTQQAYDTEHHDVSQPEFVAQPTRGCLKSVGATGATRPECQQKQDILRSGHSRAAVIGRALAA